MCNKDECIHVKKGNAIDDATVINVSEAVKRHAVALRLFKRFPIGVTDKIFCFYTGKSDIRGVYGEYSFFTDDVMEKYKLPDKAGDFILSTSVYKDIFKGETNEHFLSLFFNQRMTFEDYFDLLYKCREEYEINELPFGFKNDIKYKKLLTEDINNIGYANAFSQYHGLFHLNNILPDKFESGRHFCFCCKGYFELKEMRMLKLVAPDDIKALKKKGKYKNNAERMLDYAKLYKSSVPMCLNCLGECRHDTKYQTFEKITSMREIKSMDDYFLSIKRYFGKYKDKTRKSDSKIEDPRKNMPSLNRIWEYWQMKLDLMSLEDINNTHYCFRCGSIHNVQRAHIKPLYMEVNNDLSNIHLLCESCHNDSEFLWDLPYWDWFAQRSNYL